MPPRFAVGCGEIRERRLTDVYGPARDLIFPGHTAPLVATAFAGQEAPAKKAGGKVYAHFTTNLGKFTEETIGLEWYTQLTLFQSLNERTGLAGKAWPMSARKLMCSSYGSHAPPVGISVLSGGMKPPLT